MGGGLKPVFCRPGAIKASTVPTVGPVAGLIPLPGLVAIVKASILYEEYGTENHVLPAGGVVTVAEFHPQFGYMVEIDHGNDFSLHAMRTSRKLA